MSLADDDLHVNQLRRDRCTTAAPVACWSSTATPGTLPPRQPLVEGVRQQHTSAIRLHLTSVNPTTVAAANWTLPQCVSDPFLRRRYMETVVGCVARGARLGLEGRAKI